MTLASMRLTAVTFVRGASKPAPRHSGDANSARRSSVPLTAPARAPIVGLTSAVRISAASSRRRRNLSIATFRTHALTARTSSLRASFDAGSPVS